MRRVSYAEPARRNPPGGKQETVQTISAYRPSSGPAWAGPPSPRGRLPLEGPTHPYTGEGFFSVPAGTASIFTAQVSLLGERGVPPPLQGRTGLFAKNQRQPISRLALVFFSASGFWENIGDDNGRFLGGENGPLQKRNSYCRPPSYTVTHERSQS